MPPLPAPSGVIKKQIKRPHALLSSEAEKAGPVPDPENTDKLSSASASPRLPAAVRKRHVHSQTHQRLPDPLDAHFPAFPCASSEVFKKLCPKEQNKIQLLQKRINDLKREWQKTHDCFWMAAGLAAIKYIDDDSDADDLLVLSMCLNIHMESLKTELKRKRALVADASSSSITGGISVGP
jgi:hypothetical protein